MRDKKKTKLWMLNQFAIAPDMPGGTRHYDFAKELVKKGYDVYIFASDFSLQTMEFQRLKHGESYSTEKINGVNFVWVRTFPYKSNNYKRILNWIFFAINVYRIAGRFPRPDVILGSSPQLFTAFSGCVIANRMRVKFIAEIRDLWPFSLVALKEYYKYHPYTMLLYLLEYLVYHKADEVITFTEGNKEVIGWKGVPDEHIHVIPNGVDTTIEIDQENALRLKKQFNIKNFTIAYTGAIGVANNLEMMIDVAQRVQDKDIRILIIGDGPLKQTLLRKVSQSGLDNISIYDSIPKKDIFDLLSVVDACFITLQDNKLFRFGVSPNKLFDYMFAGKPVISSVGGWCNEIVQKSQCGIGIEPDDAEEFTQALLKLYNMSIDERNTMGKKGKGYVRKHFSRKKLIKQMIR